MKRKILLTLTLLFILSISSMVYAVPPLDDDKSYGDVTFKGNVPSDLDNVTILFEILNTTTNEKTGVELSYLNNFETSFFAEFGDYEIIPSTTKVLTKDRNTLDCYVNFVPFTVGMNNPNGDWTWIIDVNVKKNYTSEEDSERDEFEDVIINYLNDSNGNNTNSENNVSELDNSFNLLIPADNKYFSNMTLFEIKQWYISEVNEFINTGKTTLTLEEYKKDVCRWADYCFEKKENQAEIQYRAMVLKYDKDDTREFYEVQKRMYDFIKDYQETNNLYLNFETWYKTEDKQEVSSEEKENKENIDASSLFIPADNKYFPNMSLTEIKKWYTTEVEKFINTGKTNYTLEEYKENLKYWSEYCFEKKENQSKIKYQAMVLKYDKDDTREFYKVQKKMYDFIKDYQETTGLYLNFEVWDDTTVQADTIIQPNNEEKTSLDTQKNNDNIDKDNKTKEKNPLPLIIAFISIALLILGVVIVLKLKSKKLINIRLKQVANSCHLLLNI